MFQFLFQARPAEPTFQLFCLSITLVSNLTVRVEILTFKVYNYSQLESHNYVVALSHLLIARLAGIQSTDYLSIAGQVGRHIFA